MIKQNSFDAIHPDLLAAKQFAYEPSGLTCEDLEKETESEEYGPFVFKMNNRSHF